MIGAFEKIFLNNDLYNATEEEIMELEKWSTDPSVRKDTKRIYRPLFEDIQMERLETSMFTGELIIRLAEKKDFQDLIRFSRRVIHTGERTGIKKFTVEDLNVRLNEGMMFVATTLSGYIVGVTTMLVGELEGRKCGYESITMVSRLFRRKRIGEKLFDRRIEWARNNELTHINTRRLGEDGIKFLEAMEQEGKDLEFVLNRLGTSSIIIRS